MNSSSNNQHKRKRSYGFGLQRDIKDGEAILYLRITNPRRMNIELLGKLLLKYMNGGYRTLVLDQGSGMRKRMNILDFLGRLQAAYIEQRCIFLERRLRSDRVTI